MAERGRRPSEPGRARWFVALRPDRAARLRLQQIGERLAATCGGRVVPAERIHLTLAFIGSAPRALEPALREMLAGLPATGTLRLERLGSFDGRLLWLAPVSAPGWLDELAAAARIGLERLGAPFDRKRFVAHLTLVRDARPSDRAALTAIGERLEAVELAVNTLHLVESTQDRNGLHYRFI